MKTLTSGVGNITEGKFRQVNALVDRYNRQVQDCRSVMGGKVEVGFSLLARVQPRVDTPPPPKYNGALKRV